MSVGNSPNYQFGKGRFATGFIPSIPSGDGGFANRNTPQRTNIGLDEISIIERAFRNMPPPQLSIVELETKQASRKRSIGISEA